MIDISKWKLFKVKDIFQCKTTKAVDSIDIVFGDTPYITRTALLNGFSGNIPFDEKRINAGNCITVGAEGIYAFYQEDDFLAGVKVYTLRNQKLSKFNSLFICTVLNTEAYKYSYGRARVLDKLKNEDILLPSTDIGNPDWEYMEKYIKSLWGGVAKDISSILELQF